jgi:hypothetical protein
MYSQKVSKGIYKKPDEIKVNMKIQKRFKFLQGSDNYTLP